MGATPRGISASRGAAVLGLSEYQTVFEVFQRICEEREPGFNAKRGWTLPPEPDSAAIRFGTAFEDAVVELAERERGCKITDREKLYSYWKDENYITCHIDGNFENTFTLHEGKTTNAITYRNEWGTPGTDHIPRAYQVQVQHQMLCTGASEAIVSVLVFPEAPEHFEKLGWRITGGDGDPLIDFWLDNPEKKIFGVALEVWAFTLYDMGYFHQYPVKANPEVQEYITLIYRDFWERFVLPGVPPEIGTVPLAVKGKVEWTDFAELDETLKAKRNVRKFWEGALEDRKRMFPEHKAAFTVNKTMERKLKRAKKLKDRIKRCEEEIDRIKLAALEYAEKKKGERLDDGAKEALVYRNEFGEKVAYFGKSKKGVISFKSYGEE